MKHFQNLKTVGFIAVLMGVGLIINFVGAGAYVPGSANQLDPLAFLNVSSTAQSKQGWLTLGGTTSNPLAPLDVKGTSIVNGSFWATGNVWSNAKIRVGGVSAPTGTDPKLVVGDPADLPALRLRSSALAGTGDRPVCATSTGLFKICSTTPVDGVCGAANNTPTLLEPTTGLCSAGTSTQATFDSGTNLWSWNCLGQNGGNDVACSAPDNHTAIPFPTSTLYIKKEVVNNDGGTKTPGQFTIHVLNSQGVDVAGSPQPGTNTGSGTMYSLNPGTYTISENYDAGYLPTYSSSCPNGQVTLGINQTKTCTITNNDVVPHGSVIYQRNMNGTNVGGVPHYEQYVGGTLLACPNCTAERFVVPAGVTKISIEAVGGGGGGGASGYSGLVDNQAVVFGLTSTMYGGGGSGGSASDVKVQNITVSPGQTFAVYVGRRGEMGIPSNAPTCNGTTGIPGNLGAIPGIYFQGYCSNDIRIGGTGQPSFVIGPITGSFTPGANTHDWAAQFMDWYGVIYNSSTYKSVMASGAFGGKGTSGSGVGGKGIGGILAPNNNPSDITWGPTLASGLSYSILPTGTVTRTPGTDGGDGHVGNRCSPNTTTTGAIQTVNQSTAGDGGRSGYWFFPGGQSGNDCTHNVHFPDPGKHGEVIISW